MPGNPEDLEFDFVPDGFEADEPMQGYDRRDVRRTVLAPVEIEGSPDGTGSVRMGDASQDRIERTGGTVDIKQSATPPRDELAETSPWWDALTSPVDMHGAGMRTHRRLSRWWDESQRDPEASALGAASGVSAGASDELYGAAEVANPEAAFEGWGTSQTPDLQARGDAATQRARQADHAAQERAPYAYGGGQLAGTVAQAALMPSARAATGAGRLALGALEGAAIGGFGGAAQSEADTFGGRLQDAAVPALTGAAIGLGGAAVGEAGRGVMSAARASAAGRDEALLAATSHAGHNRGAVEAFDFGDTPQQIRASRARSAQVLRDSGAIPRVGTIRQTREGIEAAQGRATSTMDRIREQMAGGGPPRAEVAQRLRDRAAASQSVAGESYRDVLTDFADRSVAGRDPIPSDAPRALREAQATARSSEPLTYDLMMEELGDLRQLGAWRTRAGRDVGLTEEARRTIDREMRGGFDDAVERTLGAEERQAYQGSRQQYATLRTALENAQRGEAAVAGNRGLGFTEQMALFGGGGGGQVLGGAEGGMMGLLGMGATVAGARALRATEPRLRASGAELLHQVLQRTPQHFGRYADELQRAAARGSAALATHAHVLAQRDAEFRRQLEQLDEAQDDDATPEAIRAIGASGEAR